MRADRLLAMIILLQTRGKMTAQDLGAALGVSARTILRDVEALSLAGIPIYAEGGHGGGIALDENYRTTLTGLKESEVQALFIAHNQQLLHELGLGEAAASTLLKLTAALPTRYQASVDHIRQRIYIDPLWWWHDANTLPFWDDLQAAVYTNRCIWMRYENYDGTIIERTLEPYSLVAKSSYWYLIAKRDGVLRTYRVSRLQTMTLLNTYFQRDADFDLATYWQAHLDEFVAAFSEYEMVLCIDPDRINFARWLTPGRNTTLATDDRGWITARFQIESLELAKMLVFGLGTQVEVIAPASLKAAVLEACRTLLAHVL